MMNFIESNSVHDLGFIFWFVEVRIACVRNFNKPFDVIYMFMFND